MVTVAKTVFKIKKNIHKSMYFFDISYYLLYITTNIIHKWKNY